MDYQRRHYPLGKYRDGNPEVQKGQKKPYSGERKRNYNLNVPVICRGIAKKKPKTTRNLKMLTQVGRVFIRNHSLNGQLSAFCLNKTKNEINEVYGHA